MPIHKRFYPDKGICRVEFTLPEELSLHTHMVSVVGDFNAWKPGLHEMKKDKNGRFQCSIDLPIGRNYQFRYLIDGYDWENDWQADAYITTPFGNSENMVIICDLPGDE